MYMYIPHSRKIWRGIKYGGWLVKLKSTNIKFPYSARAKAIAHREVTWWVWSLGSSNNSWTTGRSFESLLLRTDLSRLILNNLKLSPMIGLQIFLCPHTQLAQYSYSKPLPLHNNACSLKRARAAKFWVWLDSTQLSYPPI